MSGFHVFSGSQILSSEGVIHHLRGGVNLALRAADGRQGIVPEFIDLGGGLGIPYAPGDREVDLNVIGDDWCTCTGAAGGARAGLVLELGRYPWRAGGLVSYERAGPANAPWPNSGRGGWWHAPAWRHVRPRAAAQGLRAGRDSRLLLSAGEVTLTPTDVLGCLSLPGDVPAENRLMPPLTPGDVLAFPNAGAYGLAASAWLFHSHPAPAEVAFEGTQIQPLRPRLPPESVLAGQALLPLEKEA